MRSYGLFGARRFGLVVALSAGLGLCLTAPAWARTKTITVCPGGCSFAAVQDAIGAANPGDKILIGPGSFQGPLTRSNPPAPALTIDKNLTLIGAGAGRTTLSSGNDGLAPVVQINSGRAVTIRGVTIQGSFYGTSGVLNQGNLLLSDSTVTDAGEQGISNSGTLLLSDSTVAGNFSATGGGGISNDGVMILTDASVSGNVGFIHGGGIANRGSLVVNDSAIDNNTADLCDSQDQGGGIWNFGTALINSSRFSGNSAPTGGGIFTPGGMTLRDSTVSNNIAEQGCVVVPPPLGGGIAYGGKLALLESTVNCNNDIVFDVSHPDNIDNLGTGTLTQFHSTVGGCPATATATAASASQTRRTVLSHLDRALWTAALNPPAQKAHESRARRSVVRARAGLLRQAAERVQRVLASR